jgi:hypothetical protein
VENFFKKGNKKEDTRADKRVSVPAGIKKGRFRQA